MNGSAVVARRAEKRFGVLPALDGVDLEVEPGCLLAVVGPNGAGKSTLLSLLAGLARPTAGEVSIGGVAAHLPGARARVGLVAHATFLYGALTARENLVFAARLYGVADPQRRAEALLEEQGLQEVGDRPVSAFSQGMSRRLSIARSLVHEPEVLLLDEPFSGLDRMAGRRLAERLGSLRRAGRALVLVTHDVENAVRLADRAVVLAQGRVVHRATGSAVNVGGIEDAYLRAGPGPG